MRRVPYDFCSLWLKQCSMVTFLYLILSGQPITRSVLSRAEQKRLEIQGIIFRVGNSYLLPYPILMAILHKLPKNIIREHVSPGPGVPFYWQHFEELEAHVETAQKSEVTIQELFAGALFKANLGKCVIVLTDKFYCKEKSHYLSKNKNKKVQETIPVGDWQEVNFMDAVDTAQLLQHWEASYDIVYVFITSKTISNIPEPVSLSWPSDLIVVHKPCLAEYYGLTVYQIAALLPIANNSHLPASKFREIMLRRPSRSLFQNPKCC